MHQVNNNGSKWLVLTDEQNSVYIDQISLYGSSGKLLRYSEAFEGQTLVLSKRCKFAIRINNHSQIASHMYSSFRLDRFLWAYFYFGFVSVTPDDS